MKPRKKVKIDLVHWSVSVEYGSNKVREYSLEDKNGKLRVHTLKRLKDLPGKEFEMYYIVQ